MPRIKLYEVFDSGASIGDFTSKEAAEQLRIPKSEVRTMFRLFYIEGLPWWKVAQAMNRIFPKRRVSFTEDGCRMRNNRFFGEN
jgi:hypothetical protein